MKTDEPANRVRLGLLGAPYSACIGCARAVDPTGEATVESACCFFILNSVGLPGQRMSPNFQALCYLASWEKGLPLEGGMAWRPQLQKCRLDYSWASLERIDYFLDALRTQRSPAYEDFLANQANANLLIFLAFYVVELRSRVSGEPAHWLTYQEAVEKDRRAEAYGQGFESALIAEQGTTQFLPLVSICTRLFECDPDKSVAFSAGVHIQPPEDKHKRFESLAPTSMIPQFYERYLASAIPPGYRTWIEAPVRPDFPLSDPLFRLNEDAPKLLRAGRVVWGAVVQANNNLFDPSFFGCAPAEIVYDPQGKVDRVDLYRIACRLRELRDNPQSDPALEIYGDHLRSETSRIFGWRTPPSLYPYELQASTTAFSGEISFPGYAMVGPLIPILVSEECPGSVISAPWRLWPKEVFEEWNDLLRSKFGARAKIHSQAAPKPIPEKKFEDDDSLSEGITAANSDVKPAGPAFNFVFGLIPIVAAYWMYTMFAKYEATGGGFSMPRIAVVLYSLLGKWGVVIPIGLIGAGSIWSSIRQLRNPK